MSMQSQLEVMGFEGPHVRQAIAATGGTNVETVMDWLIAHPYEPSTTPVAPTITTTPVTQPPPSTTANAGGDTGDHMDTSTTDNTPADVSTTDTPTVHNALCDHCKEQIVGIRYKCAICSDFDLCEACYPNRLVYHDPDHLLDAHTTDIPVTSRPPLTEEEKAQALKRLETRRVELKKKKEEEEKARDRERELQRRRSGQEAQEAQKKWSDAQAKRTADLARKEKEADKKAREAAKAKIARDKAEREARLKATNAAPATTPTAAPVAAAAPAVQKEYDTCMVQIRLTNGSTLTHEFRPTDKLRAVHQWVASNRTDGDGAFVLATTYPRKDYSGQALDSTTLKDADLVPRGAIMIRNL
eukprot:TRINITY_DN1871_c0_g1_i1.p1 TRINITY_DN1871_c0_g1~~TRINITY_DN1871_c0_g1_i1.p1  ORF type:complete len:357 (+),score=74.49 TRINITY_DN1871_c0_g1_i1:38-1108(+)